MTGLGTTAPRSRRRLRGLLVTLAVVVVVCVVGWLVYTNWSGPTQEPRTPDDPIEVEHGAAFVFNDLAYEAGWEIRAVSGEIMLTDLVAANQGDRIDYPDVRITLEQDSAVVATITCLGSGIKPGESTFVQCSSEDELPPRSTGSSFPTTVERQPIDRGHA